MSFSFVSLMQAALKENYSGSCVLTEKSKIFTVWIHTYIIGHYNPPSVRVIDQVSYTTYVVCVNFIHKWFFEIDFLRDYSWQFYLLSEFLTEICWEEIREEIVFVFCFDVWPGVRTLALRLISWRTTYQTTAT